MKVLVVEEEQQIVRKLERILKRMDGSIRIIGTVPSVSSSAGWLQQHGAPDLILVNNKLSEVTVPGIKATVIFTIQSDELTFQAFRVNNLRHLFHNTPPLLKAAPARLKSARNRFLVKQGQRFASIETPDIAYFFSDGRFIFFKTYDNQKYLVEYTLEELEAMLNPEFFYRINRSLLIAFKSVSQIHPYFGNRLKLVLEPGMEKDIIVSREKVPGFKLWLGE